jgi:hypothetical protein
MANRDDPKKEQVAPLVCTKELYKEDNLPRRM